MLVASAGPPSPLPAIPRSTASSSALTSLPSFTQFCDIFFLLEEMGVDLVVHVIVDVVVAVFAAHADEDVAEMCSREGATDFVG